MICNVHNADQMMHYGIHTSTSTLKWPEFVGHQT
jgi:hypothetical protein